MNGTFNKRYKLTGKKEIEILYNEGSTIKKFPFVVKSMPIKNSKAEIQIAIAVPKKNHKSAVQRNLIKRRIREAIRLNKNLLSTKLIQEQKQLAIFVIYTSKEILDFNLIEKKIKQVFEQLELTVLTK